jgi:eukaryotic-like serine/threonine-protein kinase
MSGVRFGSYSIVGEIGRGGMGAVYLGTHAVLDQLAAIKVLLPDQDDPSMVERFLNEARATARLRHPHIVQVIDCAKNADGQAYIIMEYLRGESLRSYLARRGPLGQRTAFLSLIGFQTAEALASAHAQGVIHRDVKPDNIYLAARTPSGTEVAVKVLDFGIAKIAAETRRGGSVTRSGLVIGTPLYMSPEQCRSFRDVDTRSDIYALGCIIFEMFAGRPPFDGDNAVGLISAHLVDVPPELTEIVPGVPPELSRLVARMLAKRPDARPASMSEVAQVLSAHCDPAALRSGVIALASDDRVLVPDLAFMPAVAPTTPAIVAARAGGTRRLEPSDANREVTAPPAAAGERDSTLSHWSGDRIEAGAPLARSRGPALLRAAAVVVVLGAAAAFAALRLAAPGGGGDPTPPAAARSIPLAPSVERAPRPPTSKPPTPAPASESAEVEITVEGIPPSAKLFVDGIRRTSPVRLRRGPEQHVLAVEVAGKPTRSVAVDGLRDRLVTLEPVVDAPARRPGRGAARRRDRSSRESSGPSSVPSLPAAGSQPAVKGHGDGLFTDF